MPTLKYMDPVAEDYKYIAVDGSTPYIDPTTKNWMIEGTDLGVRATTDVEVKDKLDEFDIKVNEDTTTIKKSVDQILGLDVHKLSEGEGTLSDSFLNYDYLVIRHKNSSGVLFHSIIMCDEINDQNYYGLNNATICFLTENSYETTADIYRIDGVRTADETKALEIANSILGV